MTILAFDTASSSGAVALFRDGVILAHIQLNIGLTHSEQLLPAIDDLMQLTGVQTTELDAIAITQGPGSFTGLRIGFSTAKGMALGLNKPLIPVPTLDVLAQNGAGVKGLIVPIMNARRNQVYTAVYRSDGVHIVRESDHQAIALSDLLAALEGVEEKPTIYFTGDGVDIFAENVRAALGKQAIIATGCRKYVCADQLALLAETAARHWQDGQGMRAEPLYLRESEAVIKWRQAHPGEHLED